MKAAHQLGNQWVQFAQPVHNSIVEESTSVFLSSPSNLQQRPSFFNVERMWKNGDGLDLKDGKKKKKGHLNYTVARNKSTHQKHFCVHKKAISLFAHFVVFLMTTIFIYTHSSNFSFFFLGDFDGQHIIMACLEAHVWEILEFLFLLSAKHSCSFTFTYYWGFSAFPYSF